MKRRLFALVLSVLVVLSVAAVGANTWTKLDTGKTGQRTGAVLVRAGDKMLLFGGSVKGAPYVQAFDPVEKEWAEFAKAGPKVGRYGIHPYYQAAYDPEMKTVYCLSGGPVFTFNVETKAWKSLGHPPELHGLSWHTAAIDPSGRKLVVVGSDKRVDNLGWTRTAIMDLDSGKWSALPLPAEKVVAKHKQMVAVHEAFIDLIGRIRLAWYRDPNGVGTNAELKRLIGRCRTIGEMPGVRMSEPAIYGIEPPPGAPKTRKTDLGRQLDSVVRLMEKSETLEALRVARDLQLRHELGDKYAYPVPSSRRNSPLVFDAKNRVFVLFGGDHEDYLMNDTWVLDLKKGWRRAKLDKAPSPRAGHQLVYLPKSGVVAMYEGYVQSSNSDYRTGISYPINPRQLWLYDVKANKWELAGAWRAKRRDPSLPATAGFYGYAGQHFGAPAIAATADDEIVFVAGGATWSFKVTGAEVDAALADKLRTEADCRLRRRGRFLASFCEVDVALKPTQIDDLPAANKWVKMPSVPRDVTRGCRQRDWGTAVWDAKNEQVVRWGGGHCVRSASTPVHYSFKSRRMVEGYDADEPYGYNGGGGFGSSVMGRPWVPTHGYNLYAYDPPSGLIITGTGFLYDPARMDWLRMEPMKRPFHFSWGHTVLEHSRHGAVTWAPSRKGGIGLFVYKHGEGWQDLKPHGKLFSPYCDSDGMCYDSKRDRMLLGWGGGYGKNGDGRILSFSFKTRKVEKLMPANLALGVQHNTREMVYVEHADMVLFGSGGRKVGKTVYTVAYDCAANKYLLLDAGPVTYGHGAAWMYDATRKLVLVTSHTRGIAHVLKLDPKTATLLENAK